MHQVQSEMRADLSSLASERGAEVARLSSRLDDANALNARMAEEHRAALAAYEAQVLRWREEAAHFERKLKKIHSEHDEV